MATTEDLRNELLAIMRDLLGGKITVRAARALIREKGRVIAALEKEMQAAKKRNSPTRTQVRQRTAPAASP